MRGTPHVHCLVCIKHDGLSPDSAESQDPEKISALKELLRKTVSAKLISRHENDMNDLPDEACDHELRIKEEKQYNWTPHADYFKDTNDPRRMNFDPSLNYSRTLSGNFVDPIVQACSRRLQIANQIHRCCFTCFKYCPIDEKICRFCFPWPENKNSSATDVIILKDRDKKSRVRIRLIPERNNGNVNATFVSPLINCAHGGNSDVQFIMNSHGAAEYAAGYASKAEAPDQKKLQKIFVKSIVNLQERTPFVTDCQRLNAAANAVIGSTQVGAVQAMYFILDQKFVNSSRNIINLNPRKRKYRLIFLR